MALTSRAETAALLAASGAAISKQVYLRDPPPGLLQSPVRPSGPSDLPRLFLQSEKTVTQRVSRLSSAALLYSVDKSNVDQPGWLLYGDECNVLKALHDARNPRAKTDRSCPHCRLLTDTLYGDHQKWRSIPPIHIVNHRARVEVEFDPETCMSEATLDRFQVIVPEALAKLLLKSSHPLNWSTHDGSLFEEIVAVDGDGKRLAPDEPGKSLHDKWEQRFNGGKGAAFIYEHFALPINASITSTAQNIIRITDFDKGPNGSSLSYGYSLQRCLRTNFGLAWEPSGLDVDGGRFSADVVPLENILAKATVDDAGPLSRMEWRDVLELKAKLSRVDSSPERYKSDVDIQLYKGWYAVKDPTTDEVVEVRSDKATPDEIRKAVAPLHDRLLAEWPELKPFSLLTMSARKQLHFTLPENGPIELWYILTWMAPASLFMFLNRLCQAPHFLLPKIMPATPAVTPDS